MSFRLNIDSEIDHYRLELSLPILGRVFRLKLDAPPARHFKKEFVTTEPELGSSEPPRETHIKFDQTPAEDGLKKFRMEVKRSFDTVPETATAVARDLLDRHGVQTAADLKEQYKREVFTGRIARTVGGVSGEGFRSDSEPKKVEDLPQMPGCEDLRQERDKMDFAGSSLQARLEKAESAEAMGRLLVEERGPDVLPVAMSLLAEQVEKKRDLVAASHDSVDHLHELGSCTACDIQAREDVRFNADLHVAVASQSLETAGFTFQSEDSWRRWRWCPLCEKNVPVDKQGNCFGIICGGTYDRRVTTASQKGAVESAFSEGAETTTEAKNEGGDSQ